MVAASQEINVSEEGQPEIERTLSVRGWKDRDDDSTLVNATETTVDEGKGIEDKYRSQAPIHDA
jgi:hypothetical protein